MLFTGWEVRTGKIFCRRLKNGPRPKQVEEDFLDRKQNIFQYGPTLTVNNLFIFLVNFILIPQIPVLRF